MLWFYSNSVFYRVCQGGSHFTCSQEGCHNISWCEHLISEGKLSRVLMQESWKQPCWARCCSRAVTAWQVTILQMLDLWCQGLYLMCQSADVSDGCRSGAAVLPDLCISEGGARMLEMSVWASYIGNGTALLNTSCHRGIKSFCFHP